MLLWTRIKDDPTQELYLVQKRFLQQVEIGQGINFNRDILTAISIYQVNEKTSAQNRQYSNKVLTESSEKLGCFET